MGVLDVFHWEGLSVAPGDTIFDVDPTWTRLDNMGNLRVAQVEIRRGRQDEFERTETGEMTVTFNDRDGDVDPTSVDWISRPIAFAVRNPVTDTWHPRFRGAIDDHHYSLDPSGLVKGDVQIEAVDAMDYFANFELAPGIAGDPPPPQSEGYVFFEDTTGASAGGPIGVRVKQALSNAGWPVGLSSVFTGNASLLETVYSPGEALLAVIQDAADSEFPGVANFFVDKYGVVCFHGRLARFDPATVSSTATHWDFNQWTAGTGGVQIRPPFAATRTRRLVRNAAMCYPQNIVQADRVNQVVTDPASIATHGVRSWSYENLQTKEGITSGLTGDEECLSYANYIVSNYADPQTRIDQLTLRALRPDDVRGTDLWAMVTQVDISDQVTVTRAFPGGGGITAQTYFVEGITETWSPLVKDLDTGYPFLEMTLDLSPAVYWTTEPELP